MGAAFRKVGRIHRELPPGGVLVFVTGQREVEHLCHRLRQQFATDKRRRGPATAAAVAGSTRSLTGAAAAASGAANAGGKSRRNPKGKGSVIHGNEPNGCVAEASAKSGTMDDVPGTSVANRRVKSNLSTTADGAAGGGGGPGTTADGTTAGDPDDSSDAEDMYGADHAEMNDLLADLPEDGDDYDALNDSADEDEEEVGAVYLWVHKLFDSLERGQGGTVRGHGCFVIGSLS